MSDAARLARQAFAGKPAATPYTKFNISPVPLQAIVDKAPIAVIDSAYASLISYVEALSGLRQGSSSWAVVRLYYSAYYAMKSMFIMGNILPFNGGREMMLDISSGKFHNGGSSSHHWNWHSVRQTALQGDWFSSQDSQEAYTTLRSFRENVNYTHAFTDPHLHQCLVSDEADLARRFRTYRDDTEFLYSYLPNHLAIAYPTKLIFELDSRLSQGGLGLDQERVQHAQSLWKIRDRCPLT